MRQIKYRNGSRRTTEVLELEKVDKVNKTNVGLNHKNWGESVGVKSVITLQLVMPAAVGSAQLQSISNLLYFIFRSKTKLES